MAWSVGRGGTRLVGCLLSVVVMGGIDVGHRVSMGLLDLLV